MTWAQIKFFKQSEFASKDLPGSGVRMNLEFVRKLDLIRFWFGKPIRITSGYRTKEHNEAVGGVSDSSHLTGQAADIQCDGSIDRFRLINIAMIVGIKRIGISKKGKFVHLDVDNLKGNNVLWVYD